MNWLSKRLRAAARRAEMTVPELLAACGAGPDEPRGDTAEAFALSRALRRFEGADPAELRRWMEARPEIGNVRCGAADLNGQARGKRMPRRIAHRLEETGARFPLSVLNLDILGEDIEDSPLVFQSGDPDGVLLPTPRGYVPIPWLDSPAAMLPLWMFHEDGRAFDGDPRHALADVVDRYAARGLTPVVATEMEFYLVDDSKKHLRKPISPRSGKRRSGGEILSLRDLDAFDTFFSDLYAACDAIGIPAEAATSEVGPGQFEINIEHEPDALRAADNCWLFKMLVRGMARKHDMGASFMAKPYAGSAGSGLHTHFSVLDAEGRNIFTGDRPEGSDALRHAIAGCMTGLTDLAAIYAPHLNSFDRLVPDNHAPTGICWAYENRTASLRVPSGSPAARRIEHRVAGGDVNPYLYLAAVLGSALAGIDAGLEPPPPITGNAYAQKLPQIPGSLDDALGHLEASAMARDIFPPALVDNFIATKRQEMAVLGDKSEDALLAVYLDRA